MNMKYFAAVLAAALAAAVAYVALNKSITDSIALLRPQEPGNSRELSRRHILAATGIVAILSLAGAWRILDISTDTYGTCRMMIALLCMPGAACVDYRERRIPNFFSAVMAIGGILLLGLGVLTGSEGAIGYVTTNLLSSLCCTLFFVIAAALTRQGIGAGDIKLIASLALLTGLFSVLGTLLCGTLACALAAAAELLTKKQDRHGSLPFAPFLFLGFIATILTGNF